MKTIETTRLELIPVNPQILHELFTHKSQEEIMEFMGVDEKSYEHYKNMHEKGMETHRLSLFFFILREKKSGKAIGECGFHTWNFSHRRADVFYGMRTEDVKRQGYMTEALAAVLDYGFNELGLHRIAAFVDRNNTPSVKLLKKFGFTFEGTMREDYLVNGVNEDSDCYSLLASDPKIGRSIDHVIGRSLDQLI